MGKTGNITGEVFSPEVIRQIEARQTFLGVNPKQDKHLIYQNNKTAFVRLASSINIESKSNAPVNNSPFPAFSLPPSPFQTSQQNQSVSTLESTKPLSNRNLPLTLSGDNLAKECVLFGGTVSVNTSEKTFQPKYGVGEGISNADTNLNYSPGGFGDQKIDLTSPSAYGWGGLGSQGYRPMPGIIDANVTFYNRGALAKATVNCKVYSIEQLQIFDLLYFRIGYTMLLEWGHNIFIDNTINNPTLTNRSTFFTQPFEKFFDNNSTQNDIIALIKTQRLADSYNYDAMLGKVVNFSWKFNTDGSYDISLNLVGLGDVIEALKINTSTTGNTGAKPSDLLSDEEKRLIELEKQKENAENALAAAEQIYTDASDAASSISEDTDALTESVDDFIEKFNQLLLTTALTSNTLKLLNATGEYDTSGNIEDDNINTEKWNNITLGNLVEGITNVAGGKGISGGQKESLLGKKITYPKIDTALLLQYVEKKDFVKSDGLINSLFAQVEKSDGPFQTSVRKYFKLLLNPGEGITEKNIVFNFFSYQLPRTIVNGRIIGAPSIFSGAVSRGAFSYNSQVIDFNQQDVSGVGELPQKPTPPGNAFSYSTIKDNLKKIYEKVKTDGNKKLKAQNNAQSALGAARGAKQASDAKLKALNKEIARLKEKLQTFPASSAEFRDKSTFNRQLYDWTTKIKEVKNSTGVINEPITLNNIQIQSLKAYFKELDPTLTDDKAQTIAITSTISGGTPVVSLASKVDDYIKDLNKNKNPDFCKYSFNAIAQDAEIAGQILKVDQYYVRLGYMLEWIQNNLLIYSDGKTFEVPKGIGMSVANGVPLFNINTDINGNVLKYFPSQISSDPKICLIPIRFVNEYKGLKSAQTTTDSKTKKETTDVITQDLNVNWSAFCDSKSTTQADLSNYFIEGESDAARLMNIMVNIDYASGVLAQNVDSNGKVTLLNFLNSLCLGISDSLGNINKLNTIYDGETNELKIIDENGINIAQNQTNTAPANGISEPTIGKFRVYGVNPGTEGSFVTNVDFQVQIPPNMAAMATISAQASGNIAGENATGLSRLNTGLIDRIVPSKLDAESLKSKSTIGTTQDPNVIFGTNLTQMNKFVEELYETSKYISPNVESLKSINRDVSLFETGKRTDANIAPAPFFIPFNLSLDMDGLSGMRNFERFSITEDILPYSYRSSDAENGGVIDFIIKGISHNISNNQWKTKIESQTISSIRRPQTRS